jgi:replication factor C small subunit
VSFREIIGQDKIVARIKSFVNQQNIPHLLFSGPAGVGKTTLSLVDECDSLTREAQQALRRTMENYTSSCRFILSCNYSSKIIDPIQSRCAVFRFRPLEKEFIKKIIENIAKKEGLNIDDKSIDAIYSISEGDARKTENILQSCASVSKQISELLVYEIASAAQPKELKEVLDLAIQKDFTRARSLLLDVMLKHGLSGIDMIKQIQKEIWNLELEDEKKLKLVEKCGEIEFRMVEGSDEYLQLESLLASFN